MKLAIDHRSQLVKPASLPYVVNHSLHHLQNLISNVVPLSEHERHLLTSVYECAACDVEASRRLEQGCYY